MAAWRDLLSGCIQQYDTEYIPKIVDVKKGPG